MSKDQFKIDSNFVNKTQKSKEESLIQINQIMEE